MKNSIIQRMPNFDLRQELQRVPGGGLLAGALGGLALGGCSFILDFDELTAKRTVDAAADSPAAIVSGDAGSESKRPGAGGSSSAGASSIDAGGPAGQGGWPGDAAADGGTESAGQSSGGNAGDAGSPNTEACDADCDDDDPCTTDTCRNGVCNNEPLVCTASNICRSSTCVDGECMEVPFTGIVPDDFETTLVGKQLFRSSLIASDSRFYAATYGEFGSGKDIRISAFDAEGDGTIGAKNLASGLSDAYEISSPAALAATQADEFRLSVFVAIRQTVDGTLEELGNLIRVDFDSELALVSESVPLLANAPTYAVISDEIGPAAGFVRGADNNSAPYVTWFGRNAENESGIFIYDGVSQLNLGDLGANFIAEPSPISGLSAIDTPDTPGAVWMTEGPDSEIRSGTAAGEAPITITQCDDSGGNAGHSLNASRTYDDLWTVTWSQSSGDTFQTENTILDCSGTTCVDTGPVDAMACSSEDRTARVNPGVRGLVLAPFERSEEPGTLYQAITVARTDGVSLFVNRVDLNNDDSDERFQGVGSVTLAVTPDGVTPDRPAMAVIPPNKLAVSWIQRGSDGESDELHLQRHRICFGDE